MRDRNLYSGSIRSHLAYLAHFAYLVYNRRKRCYVYRAIVCRVHSVPLCASRPKLASCVESLTRVRVFPVCVRCARLSVTHRLGLPTPAPPGHVAALPRALPRMLVACFALLFTPYYKTIFTPLLLVKRIGTACNTRRYSSTVHRLLIPVSGSGTQTFIYAVTLPP